MDIVIFADYSHAVYGKPAGPYRIATELRKNGFTVQVIEYLTKWRMSELYDVVEKFVGPETLFVGFCNTFFSRKDRKRQIAGSWRGTEWQAGDFFIPDEDAAQLVSWIKAKNRETKIVMGGANAVRCDNPLIEVFVGGYADNAVVALANHLRHGTDLKTMKLPDGSVFVDSQVHYPVSTFKHGIQFEENDFVDENDPISIEVARGCVFKCAYCAFPLNGKKRNDYIRPYDQIRDEVMRNYDMFGTTTYLFVDDTYNDAIDKIEGMANMIAKLPFKMRWSSYARLDIMTTERNREMPVLMKESGAQSINFGIETLHYEAGKKIGKGMQPEKTIEALHWVKSIWGDDIQTHANFIVGLPGEPVESVYRTHELLMQPDFPVHAFYWNAFLISPPVRFPTKAFTSRIDDNAKGFGYIHQENPEQTNRFSTYWKNEHMDYPEASRIEREFNENDETLKRVLSCGTRYPNYKMIMNPKGDDWRMYRYDFDRSNYRTLVTRKIRQYIQEVLSS